jgi:hypothetical protein
MRRLGICLGAKMSVRNLHSPSLEQALGTQKLSPVFFLPERYLASARRDRPDLNYQNLFLEKYQEYLKQRPFLGALQLLRRYGVLNESRDEKLRASLITWLETSHRPLWKIAAGVSVLERLSACTSLVRMLGQFENIYYRSHIHKEILGETKVSALLVPAMGGFGFWPEGQLALTAQSMRLPVVSVITNYDNLLNRGWRLFLPDQLAVWGKQMAEDAIGTHKIEPKRVHIVGPVQFDRYFKPLRLSRQDFFTTRGLNHLLPTIFLAGGSDIPAEILVIRLLQKNFGEKINIIYRPYPDASQLGGGIWEIMGESLRGQPGLYLSIPNSIGIEAESKSVKQASLDLSLSESEDELVYLLKYSSVLLNYFSTISLEAAVCDLPTIHLAWRNISMLHLINQTHNRRKLRLAASKVSHCDKDLIGLVDSFLQNPKEQAGERRLYSEYECGSLDGKSSERLAALVASQIK